MPLRSAAVMLAILLTFDSATIARERYSDFEINEVGSPPEATQARSQADAAYQQGNYSRVVELADFLIQNYPGDHVQIAYHLRASAKIEMGRMAGSGKQIRDGIADARQALSFGGNEFPWLHIPYLYGLSSLAEVERRPEHADLAIKVVTPVLQYPATKDFTEDDRANLYYQRGLAYAARGDFKLAAADQAQAIRLSPGHLGAYVKRAEAYSALRQARDALAAYDEAVARFPNVLLVFNDRGKYRRSTGDLEGAIEDFSRCLAIDPKSAVGYLNRGVCLADQNNPQAAEGDFTEALNLKPNAGLTSFAYRLRAAARLAQGNSAAAIADYSAAAKAAPQDATLYEERGFANLFQKDFAAAAADFAKALQINPQLARVLPWHAVAQSRSGQTAEARSLLETALAGKSPPTGWTAKVCGFLLDHVAEPEFLDATADANVQEKARRVCEAHYFIGQKQLLREDGNAASDHFREAAGTKQYSLSAYRGARYELGDFK